MKFRLALTVAATAALAACGSTEDASTEAEAETVEVAADEALADIDAAPVADPAANLSAPEADSDDVAATEDAQIQAAGDNAADTAAAAMDAMAADVEN